MEKVYTSLSSGITWCFYLGVSQRRIAPGMAGLETRCQLSLNAEVFGRIKDLRRINQLIRTVHDQANHPHDGHAYIHAQMTRQVRISNPHRQGLTNRMNLLASQTIEHQQHRLLT